MDAVVVKVWLNELTLLQEQPKTAMEEAGVALLDSCTCYDYCPGSLKDNARSGNYHPLAACWRHLASSFQCHWIECMRQALILKQEHPKASLEEAAVVFWGLVTRVCMLFMRHHCINILRRQCVGAVVFGGKCDALSCAHSAGTAHSCHGGGWSCCVGAFFLLWWLSLILERSCGLWK